MEYYHTSLQHILAELERIDLLIRMQVWHARQVQETDELQGLYISEQEVDALLAGPAGLPRWATVQAPLSPTAMQTALERLGVAIAQRKTASLQQGVSLRLVELGRLFGLTPFDLDVILICLAPEIDLRYERLYAYLQDDVTRKHPSVDLVLNLLCPAFEAKLAARQRFTASAPLRQQPLLSLFTESSQPQSPLLNHSLKLEERVVSYLLNGDELDSRLLPYARYSAPRIGLEELALSPDLKQRLALLLQAGSSERRVCYLQGPYGTGKHTTAEALCRAMGSGLLMIALGRLLETQELRFETAVRLLRREGLLQNAALYWEDFDSLLADDKQVYRDIFCNALQDWPGVTFLAGNTVWEPAAGLRELPFVRVELARQPYAERLQLWTQALAGAVPVGAEVDVNELAGRFRFSGGQILDAAATARNLARWRVPDEVQVSMADLYTACRLHSNRRLATLAQSITPRYAWDDIVLPAEQRQQLREICNYVKYRPLVYEQWGFGRKLAMGKGLNVLFAGPSGTGKTLAAEIMAHELGLDLYKIDLSTVVSKYIGETEKNLSRIFAEAESSNAVLFFDEADALFGKRSEVRDAHDRYANIEISYLLQKMEEYEGVVILATNLRKNMDEAFVRRMHFTVEFPFPKVEDRRRIWENIWPDATPRAVALDLDFMARRFEMVGGNIRNIALAAAFLAAEEGGVITMTHLIRATRREYQKMGKVVMEGEFGEYARLG